MVIRLISVLLGVLCLYRVFAVVIFDLPCALGCVHDCSGLNSILTGKNCCDFSLLIYFLGGTPAPCVTGCKVRDALSIDLDEYLQLDPVFGGSNLKSARAQILTAIVSFIATPLLILFVIGLWFLGGRWVYVAGLIEAILMLSLLAPVFWEYYLLAPNHYLKLWAFNVLDMLIPFVLLYICLPPLCATPHKHKNQ